MNEFEINFDVLFSQNFGDDRYKKASIDNMSRNLINMQNFSSTFSCRFVFYHHHHHRYHYFRLSFERKTDRPNERKKKKTPANRQKKGRKTKKKQYSKTKRNKTLKSSPRKLFVQHVNILKACIPRCLLCFQYYYYYLTPLVKIIYPPTQIQQ